MTSETPSPKARARELARRAAPRGSTSRRRSACGAPDGPRHRRVTCPAPVPSGGSPQSLLRPARSTRHGWRTTGADVESIQRQRAACRSRPFTTMVEIVVLPAESGADTEAATRDPPLAPGPDLADLVGDVRGRAGCPRPPAPSPVPGSWAAGGRELARGPRRGLLQRRPVVDSWWPSRPVTSPSPTSSSSSRPTPGTTPRPACCTGTTTSSTPPGSWSRPRFRPSWSPDILLGADYLGRSFGVRRGRPRRRRWRAGRAR